MNLPKVVFLIQNIAEGPSSEGQKFKINVSAEMALPGGFEGETAWYLSPSFWWFLASLGW